MRNSFLMTLGVFLAWLLAKLYPAIKQVLYNDWRTMLPALVAFFVMFELRRRRREKQAGSGNRATEA